MQSGSSTAPRQYYYVGFLLLPFFAAVGTEVSLPPDSGFCLAVVPHGGRGSTARAEVPPPAPVRLFIGSVLGLRQYRGSVR